MWKHSYKTQSQYTQNYSLIQLEVLSLSIQRIGLNTKFETAPKTRRSFRFSKIAAQPPSHSPLQRDLPFLYNICYTQIVRLATQTIYV